MKPRAGQRLASTIDDTNVIVVLAPDSDAVLTCTLAVNGTPLPVKSAKPLPASD